MKWSIWLGLALVGSVQATTVIFDNSTPANSIGNRAISLVPEYQSFTSSPGAFSVTDLEVTISTNVDSNVFTVGLYANNANTPGALLAVIGSRNDNTLTLSCTCIYDFPTLPIDLAPSTRYWIGLSTTPGPGASSVNWSIEGPFLGHPGDIGVTGELIDDTGVVMGDNGEAFQMKVTVSPTVAANAPEPSTMLLGAAGLGALLLVRKAKHS